MVGTNDKFWKDKNIFITGGTGFLGSYLTKALVDYGANVTLLVRDDIPKSNLYSGDEYKSINVVRGSLEDYYLIERILGEYEIDTVFHLAAQAIVGVSNRNPLGTFISNIQGTWNILEASRRSPLIRRVVVASSDKAYGDQEKLPYDESMPLQGKHPYDVSKSCADLIAQSYYETYKLPVCITRCGNLYGGGDLNFNRIIPQSIKSILKLFIKLTSSTLLIPQSTVIISLGFLDTMSLTSALLLSPCPSPSRVGIKYETFALKNVKVLTKRDVDVNPSASKSP